MRLNILPTLLQELRKLAFELKQQCDIREFEKADDIAEDIQGTLLFIRAMIYREMKD